ncbi:MAG: PDZ domain-containing protein [Candidatus Poribacteria bacterium]|nr:PDZ domain-containing protein [Candidatus Poribacteria bacterium]
MAGYYRSPALFGDDVTFVCEDDLWIVPVGGGIPRRLTSNLGPVSWPRVSPDGTQTAFIAREEGPSEVYIMPSLGGEAKRLTYQAGNAATAAWNPEGEIVYSSNAHGPYAHVQELWTVSPEGDLPKKLPYGPAARIAYGPDGQVVLGRHAGRDPSWWKRYRGGTAGQLWIDADGDGVFERLNPVDANYTAPMWIDGRVYFIADHEGFGNIYSCLPNSEDLRRHTDHETYYARAASRHENRIVYHAGADLFFLDLNDGKNRKIEIDYRSPFIQRQRKFVNASQYLHGHALHPDGHAVAVAARGKLFSMANWEGAVAQHGERDSAPFAARRRLAGWLNDGKRIAAVSDAGGEETIEIHAADGKSEPVRLEGLDIGRPNRLEVSPKKDQLLLTNNRFELLLIDLEEKTLKVLDKSEYRGVGGAVWSPDGRWIAYGFAATRQTASIKIVDVETGEARVVTHREFIDGSPGWDPDGKYLYFISNREFNPIYNERHFGLTFLKTMRPYLLTLKADELNPFIPQPRPIDKKDEKKKKDGKEENAEKKEGNGNESENSEKTDEKAEESGEKKEKKKDEKKEKRIEIDFEGIERRTIAFPFPAGVYSQIDGIEGKALIVSRPSPGGGSGIEMHSYEFKNQKKEVLVKGLDGFSLSRDRKTLSYRSGNRIRVVKAGAKPGDGGGTNRAEGWIDLNRVKPSVVPLHEWRQMYREAWRLQRDHFWTDDMSGVDWERVYERYLPMLERVGTRTEFADLMWEMQGELGTSHAYEMGGDYRSHPDYGQGFLGADFERVENGFAVRRIVEGDSWSDGSDSPLSRAGAKIKPGDVIASVAGLPAAELSSPSEALVNLAGQETELVVRGEDGNERVVVVKPIGSEAGARYREWVVQNRRYVHERTDGQVGYVHIPDMGVRGYAEFHRAYLAELDFPALIVDVRHNRGGHVSQLLLEKLARKRIGYTQPRYGEARPYPGDSVLGPMAALTDENAGSDGDIFSHCFKLMGLGPLIGMRTWGGVIGISPKSRFVDSGHTTQPEYSFWFEDVEWGVENYGTDPDIEVPYAPHDYVAGRDPQMERGIEVILGLIEENPPRAPELQRRPRLTLPTLPPRSED